MENILWWNIKDSTLNIPDDVIRRSVQWSIEEKSFV